MDIFSLLSNLLLFITGIFFCFYIPGKVISAYYNFKLISLEKYVFPIGLGFALFTLVCYILDSFHVFFLIYPILLVFGIFFITKKLWLRPSVERIDMWAFLFIAALSLFFAYTTLSNGLYPDGVHFININATDGTFHMSLMQELQHHFPPDHPGFAGSRLSGYHVFSDYVWAKFSQIFHVPILFLFFQYEPVFIALLWGSVVYLLLKRWTNSKAAGLWGVFFTQFGGSAAFIVYLLGHKNISLNSGFGMLQSSVALINPPFTGSIIILLFGLFSLLQYLQTKERKWMFPLILFFGLGAEFKVYAGILLLGGFCFFLVRHFLKNCLLFFKEKKSKRTIASIFSKSFIEKICIFIGILIIFSLTYFPLSGGGGYLIFFPYWAPIDIVRSNLSYMNYDNQMYVYKQLGMMHRIVWLQIRIFLLFLFGNLGSRTIGFLFLFFYPKKREFFFSEFTYTVFCMMVIAFCIPLFFIQSIKPFEITQMFNYFLFFGGLFAAVGCGSFFALRVPKFLKIIIFAAIVLLTVPSAIEIFYSYYPLKVPTVPLKTYQGMQYLKAQGFYTDTVIILSKVTDVASVEKNDTLLHSTNMLIPALINKRVFFNDENITYPVDIHNRLVFLSQIVRLEQGKNSRTKKLVLENEIIKKLQQNHIKYIYSTYKLPLFKEINLKQMYTTDNAFIYKVL